MYPLCRQACGTIRTGTQAVDITMTDLEWVRRQLDQLAETRLLAGLSPEDEAYWAELCWEKGRLLDRASTRPSGDKGAPSRRIS